MTCIAIVDSETGLYNSRSFGVGALKVSRYYDPSLSLWLGVDPLADSPNNNYMTPYHYVANNPISNIDPDGRDWFQSEDGATIWQDSHDDTWTDSDGVSYNNIGTHYIEDMGDGMMGIYNQNELVHTGSASDFSAGLSAGSGHGDGDILYSGDKAFTKNELFAWGAADNAVERYIMGRNQPLSLQKEFWGYMKAKNSAEVAPALAMTFGAPLVLIAGAEGAAAAGAYDLSASSAQWVMNNSSWLNKGNWWRLGRGWNPATKSSNIRAAWGAHENYIHQVPRAWQGLNKWLRSLGGGHKHFPKWK